MKAKCYMNDGTEKVVEGSDLKALSEEVAELVNGSDFAVKPESVCLLTDDGEDGQELEVHYSLELVDPTAPTT